MLRSLKRLGAVVVVLVIGAGAIAMPATAKIIHDFEAESTPYILTGTSTTNHEFRFGKSGAVMTCASSSLYGTFSSSPMQSFTVQPMYKTCTLSGLAATVDTPCTFNMTGETDAFEHGKVHIECEGENEIRITISGCTVEIPGQSPNQGAHYTSTGTGSKRDLDVSVTVNEAVYTTVGPFCGIIGGLGNDLSILGSYTVEAFQDKENAEGSQIGLSMKATIF